MSIHYDKNTINQIRQTDMIEFFNNYKRLSFKKQGNDFRCIEHDSLVVKGDKVRWFWNSKGIGGLGVIDYLMKIEYMSFQDAIATVQNKVCSFIPLNSLDVPKKKDFFSLPEKGKFPYIKLIEYLCVKRGIDESVVYKLIKDNKIYQDIKENVVFIGYDENNIPKFASIRGTGEKQFRMDCDGSDKKYSFSINGTSSKTVYIFESPIDVLSFITLKNIKYMDNEIFDKYSYLSLGGTSSIALDSYLQRNKKIKNLVFCLDNDIAGQNAIKKIILNYSKFNYTISKILPKYKDFNDDLVYYQKNRKNKIKYTQQVR